MRKNRPLFNVAVRSLLEHIVETMEEFRHVKPSRILIVAGEARRASRGTVKPLCFDRALLAGQEMRKKPVVKIKGRRMLYCITLRPLYFRASTPEARIATLLHELFHISSKFDGTLAQTRRHASAGKAFARKLQPLVRKYLKACPPELVAPFAYDGEVRVQQWLERPATFYVPGTRVRRLYTEEQMFVGPVRMVTKRTRPAKPPRAKLKIH